VQGNLFSTLGCAADTERHASLRKEVCEGLLQRAQTLEQVRVEKVCSMLGVLQRAVARTDAAAPAEEEAAPGSKGDCECTTELVEQIDGYFGRASTEGGPSTEASYIVEAAASKSTGMSGHGLSGHGHRAMSEADKSYLRGDVRVLLKQDGLCSAGLQITARVITR
jgi:hypothetical protein